MQRRYPVGAELQGGALAARVWAPRCQRVELVLIGEGGEPQRELALTREPGGAGYFSGVALAAAAGQRYAFRLDGAARWLPDPASRCQPLGPTGPSQLIDPARYRWRDGGWRGLSPERQVLYELHVGSFTRAGSFCAAAAELPRLAELGITALELMPIAEFPGAFGWGYDGVNLWAPSHLYGTPDQLRALIDRAHQLGLGVLLDVVYNHLGPAHNTLPEFSQQYLSERYPGEWGAPLNFDGPGCEPVREFCVENAAYWIDEFHFDGLRVDAAQAIHDASPEHLLRQLARRAREAAGERQILLVAEHEAQQVRLVEPPERGGYGLDAMWNDDFHHSARVAACGRAEAYYSDYRGSAQELLAAARWGFLYQGQHYPWQGAGRGSPALHLTPQHFVAYLQNHDQVANSLRGLRLHQLTSPGRLRALTALLLLGPATPLLFQGQEFAAPSPFLYFADQEPELAAQTRQGRAKFLTQFPSLAAPASAQWLADPSDRLTFERCRLELEPAHESAAQALALHRDLLRLRHSDPVFAEPRAERLHGAVLGPELLLLRHVLGGDADRLLLINLGRDAALAGCAEPLLAPPAGRSWQILWSSEDPAYGGLGVPAFEPARGLVPGHSALMLQPTQSEARREPDEGEGVHGDRS